MRLGVRSEGCTNKQNGGQSKCFGLALHHVWASTVRNTPQRTCHTLDRLFDCAMSSEQHVCRGRRQSDMLCLVIAQKMQ